jgi:hypothetical protein
VIKIYIEEIKNKIDIYKKLLVIIDIEPRSIEEEIFLMYAQSRRVAEVAAYVNNKNYRVPGTNKEFRKYISDDITKVLEREDLKELVDKKLYNLVIRMKKTRKLTDEIILEVFNAD